MMQSYNDFTVSLDRKNVLTHTFLFKNWPYTYIFIFMLDYLYITPIDL